MHVLVTGSRGTLGRPLVEELERRGHVVSGCDLAHSDAPYYRRADVANYRQLERVLFASHPEVIVHLAAEFGRMNGEQYYEEVWTANAIGTRNVLQLAREYRSSVVFASSSEVYGDSFGVDLDEDLLDRTPVLLNDYAISKWTNELQIRAFTKRHPEVRVNVLRFFNAYGPGERYHPYRSVVCLFCWRALNGMSWDVYKGYERTFMYSGDFIPSLATAAELTKDQDLPVINIGGEDFRSVEELSQIVVQASGCDPKLARLLPPEAHNVASKRPDITRAREYLGHDPKVRLEEGVPLTLEWMKSLR